MNQQDRYLEVLNYIDANLDRELDLQVLAEVAHISRYHFHRQFSGFVGMSVMALCKLLRRKRAAYQLAYREDLKIVDVAFGCGYDSQEAFTRAFKKHFSQTPLQFKTNPNWEPWQTQYEPIQKLRNRIMGKNKHYDINLVDFPEVKIAVIEHHGAPHLLGQTISSFIHWRKTNGLPPNKSRTFNLVYDDPAVTKPEDFQFDIACEVLSPVEKNNHNVINKVIPQGKCAVARHVGSDDGLESVVRYLYSEWLPSSGYELRGFPLFFERVSFFPDVAEHEMVTDVYLPIS